MVLKIKQIKNAIKIYGDFKVFPSNLKLLLLNSLIDIYDVFEYKNNDLMKLNKEDVLKSINIKFSEVLEYKKIYEMEKIKDIKFEEFLEMFKVNFSLLYIFNKNAYIGSINKMEKMNSIAVVDLNPDGDVHCIWIDTFTNKKEFLNLFTNLLETE